jgi:hypothetical protein
MASMSVKGGDMREYLDAVGARPDDIKKALIEETKEVCGRKSMMQISPE